ncbi:Cu-oxidase domain-containing protein/Cu-oxidase_2 domain-containing protein/Cu-oxidase_3 domain-containing protein [Cephalotus follicularis]|uniref:Laccase n=1 Tax=Cephalotus follicularis TaxID=3775 RepID=A0A1Q3BCC0_CEPFO|nr:Cu-oxidase domain-containing protein/Cu-oxidase_2 domain-containing protein/Cu-oxidase_3 domain-containing protein [Cephalotus follicularis]
MARPVLLLACAILLLASTMASCAIVEHSFYVKNMTVNRLCNEHTITAVNGRLPGPTIRVQVGDTLIVHVHNQSPYNVTIHWHGVFQILTSWSDGPNMVTQCPIQPGNKYTYKFNLLKQEGTLWWHAHASWLRATVHGALFIRPKSSHLYPFPKPHKEVRILLGEWWNGNVIDIVNAAVATGAAPNSSNAFTINGRPGDLYSCSQNQTYKLKVVKGKTYLLRIINAALNNQLFYKIANHNMTVVAADASYTNPYVTDVVVVAPGQTVDALLTADQPVGSYYMAATAYESAVGVPFDNTTTRGVIVYEGSTSVPLMPVLPAFNDTPTDFKFNSNITALTSGTHWVPVPTHVDEDMFVTVGLGYEACTANATCGGPNNTKFSASMNNESFVLPTTLSLLQAFFFNKQGIYNATFPNNPPVTFDYTNASINSNTPLLYPPKSTAVKILKYNSTVQMVLQNTAVIGVENHPMHIHGLNFYVLAQGFGNFDPKTDNKSFNLINPMMRNTIGVPVGGWAVIRFYANNPGVWIMHCHLDVHLTWGLATAFLVENGPTPSSTLTPPPADLPQC